MLTFAYMSSLECIQGFSHNLFWDVKPETIDMETHAPYVVQRVLEYGQWDDWNRMVAYYGLNRIKQIAIALRSLEPKAFAFISLLTSTPKSAFRCYTLRHSTLEHWRY